MRYDDALKIIADHYGYSSRADMLCEEAAEYITARSKIKRGVVEAAYNFKEELADVLIVALQLRYLLGEKNIDDIIEQKIQRQLRRMQGEDSSFTVNISKPDKMHIFEEMKKKQREQENEPTDRS